MCKIAILEDYSLFCSGIKPVLAAVEGFEIVAEARHINDLIPLIGEAKPDVVIVDVLHCEQEGLGPIRKIRRKSSKIPVLLIVSKDYAEHFEDYISLGINGFVFNDTDASDLVLAVRKLKEGEDFFPPRVWMLLKSFLRSKKKILHPESDQKKLLSNRETAVLKLFCKGYTYKEIGKALNISPRTVETHKKNIQAKIKVRSTAEMVEYALENNL